MDTDNFFSNRLLASSFESTTSAVPSLPSKLVPMWVAVKINFKEKSYKII